MERDEVAARRLAVPNSTYGVLKSLNVHRNSTSTSTRLTGRSEGSVMWRNCRRAGAVDRGGLVEVARDALQARPSA